MLSYRIIVDMVCASPAQLSQQGDKMISNFFKRVQFLLVGACSLTVPLLATAQSYPTKPITLVVPFAAGGPTDIVARTLAANLSKTIGQSVVVENKIGAGGTLASAYVAKAAPDGYTFLIHHNGMSTAPALYRKMSFNPLTDFEYVSQAVDVPMTLLGRKDLPAKNMQELSAYVKANAKKINLANAGLGAVSHLCGMLFQQAMGVDFLGAACRHRADGADHAAIDGDIGGKAGAAGAIQHMAAANDEVVAHDCAPRMRRPGRAPVAWPWAWTIWPATRVAA
jgi:tripartite-type tricarboxylate transporter receptor subunit TctC